jgi:hypothetical protein
MAHRSLAGVVFGLGGLFLAGLAFSSARSDRRKLQEQLKNQEAQHKLVRQLLNQRLGEDTDESVEEPEGLLLPVLQTQQEQNSSMETTQSRVALAKSLRSLFNACDTENLGYISKLQFAEFLSKLGLPNEREGALMSIIDISPKISIDFLDFLLLWEGTLANQAEQVNKEEYGTAIRVFLGGACGKTMWRHRTAIPLFAKHGVTFYNPHVQDWNPNLLVLENLMKAWCQVLLFVIGKETRALASMIEAAQNLAEKREVVLVITDCERDTFVEDQRLGTAELKDLNRARTYLRDVARQYGVPVFETVAQACQHIVAEHERERAGSATT